MTAFDRLKQFILSWEGGYVNNPKDPGGATNKGVTLIKFREVYGKLKTIQDLKNLTDLQWTYIYKTQFWDKWKADQIEDDSIKYLLVDWIWHSGIGMISRVQKELGLVGDNIVGSKTLAALNSGNHKEMFDRLWHLRENFLKTRKTFVTFGKGWMRRLNSIQYGKLIDNK